MFRCNFYSTTFIYCTMWKYGVIHILQIGVKVRSHIVISQSLGLVKPLYISPLGRPVPTTAISTSLGSIRPYCRYSFIQLSELRQCGMNEWARGFKLWFSWLRVLCFNYYTTAPNKCHIQVVWKHGVIYIYVIICDYRYTNTDRVCTNDDPSWCAPSADLLYTNSICQVVKSGTTVLLWDWYRHHAKLT